MKIFVYGTLKKGHGNYKYFLENNDDVAFIREDQVVCAKLYNLGGFPGVVLEGDDRNVVHGEIYEIGDKTLARLDRLEGHPRFYERVQVTSVSGEKPWVYTLTPEKVKNLPVIEDGVWSPIPLT